MKVLKMCLNWKVLLGITAIGISIFAFAPSVATLALPFLLLALCPIVMILMMGSMHGMTKANVGASLFASEADLEPNEQLAQLKTEQQHLADKIALLEARQDTNYSNQAKPFAQQG